MGHHFITPVQAAFDLLAQAICDRTFCLAVGAGASMDVGVPGWYDLLAEAARRRHLRRRRLGTGHEISWSYEIVEQFGAIDLESIVYSRRVKAASWVTERGFLNSAPFILAVLAIASAKLAPERSFHVISYNVDLLLEEAIEALGHRALTFSAVNRKPGSFTGGADTSLKVTLPKDAVAEVRIFHPHGFVQRDGSKEGLVMAAKAYDQLASAPFNSATTFQLAAFSEFLCLFYGFSFLDPNVRRLLRVSRNNRGYGRPLHIALGTHSHLGKRGSVIVETAYEDCDQAEDRILFAELGVERLRHHDFEQHKYFVRELLRHLKRILASTKGGFDWPSE